MSAHQLGMREWGSGTHVPSAGAISVHAGAPGTTGTTSAALAAAAKARASRLEACIVEVGVGLRSVDASSGLGQEAEHTDVLRAWEQSGSVAVS